MIKLSQNRLLDEMMDAYLGWRESCLMTEDAYRAWASATGPDAALAFGRYVAALDGEELTAGVYADLVRRVGRLVTSEAPGAFARPAPGPRLR
jgi:hypothetical protein